MRALHRNIAVVVAGLSLGMASFGMAQPKEGAGAKAAATIGGPYALNTCAWTGKKLGTMGDPVVKTYEGREVRFCCSGCIPKFEKDLTASFTKGDAKIVADQKPIYPLKTSVVTGKDLPAAPVDFVYGNRLVRLGAQGEKAEFLKDPAKHLETLDKAVVEQQKASYGLTTCAVSGEKLGEMGEPKDIVLAGRLVRLCCKDCVAEVEKDPAAVVAKVDGAKTKSAPKDDSKDGPEKPKTDK